MPEPPFFPYRLKAPLESRPSDPDARIPKPEPRAEGRIPALERVNPAGPALGSRDSGPER